MHTIPKSKSNAGDYNGSSTPGAPKLRPRNPASRPRPKTIHIESNLKDSSHDVPNFHLTKKGSSINLAGLYFQTVWNILLRKYRRFDEKWGKGVEKVSTIFSSNLDLVFQSWAYFCNKFWKKKSNSLVNHEFFPFFVQSTTITITEWIDEIIIEAPRICF